jgi:hypothetical protein
MSDNPLLCEAWLVRFTAINGRDRAMMLQAPSAFDALEEVKRIFGYDSSFVGLNIYVEKVLAPTMTVSRMVR